MRAHGSEVDSYRPQGDRIPHGKFTDPEEELSLRAAAEGRLDALSPQAMLGLQRTAGNAALAQRASAGSEESLVHEVIGSGGGSPLDTDTRSAMEERLGADFSDVRVHTDGAAHESAKSVNAQAYTVGSHIVFQRDRFDPSTPDGQVMLAHELTHVMQQRSGPVEGTDRGDGVRVSHPSDRFERDAVANAERVMSTPPAAAAEPAPAVQRSTDEHEQAVQRTVDVQRDEMEEAEEDEDKMAQTFVQREGEEEEQTEEE
ncbi:MAG TPA: DUF4157 domain-containing protein [Candidatus Limnocylindrales bacterium]|nr:DUF4157 domain-containing protein [Candidatus Limnocylindrales bacterium]